MTLNIEKKLLDDRSEEIGTDYSQVRVSSRGKLSLQSMNLERAIFNQAEKLARKRIGVLSNDKVKNKVHRGLVTTLAYEYELKDDSKPEVHDSRNHGRDLLQWIAYNARLSSLLDKDTAGIASELYKIRIMTQPNSEFNFVGTDKGLLDMLSGTIYSIQDNGVSAHNKLKGALFALSSITMHKNIPDAPIYAIVRSKYIPYNMAEGVTISDVRSEIISPVQARYNLTTIEQLTILNTKETIKLVGTRIIERNHIETGFKQLILEAGKESSLEANMLVGLNRTVECFNDRYDSIIVGPLKKYVRKIQLEEFARLLEVKPESIKKAYDYGLIQKSNLIASNLI